MILVDKTLHILNALSGVNTVLYDSPWMQNFRIDRKTGPFALMYPIVDIEDSFSNQNTYKEAISIEVFFADVVKFDADGEAHLEVVDDMYEIAKAFVHQLQLDKDIMIDGDVRMHTGYGKYDKYLSGVSVECKLVLRQPVCLASEEPEVRTLTITENGEYDVLNYGKVIVNVQEPEPQTDVFYIKNESAQLGTLIVTDGGGVLKYSFDAVNWAYYDFSSHPTINVQAGKKLYMKGAKTNPSTNSGYLMLRMDVNHSIGGNIMSIVDETNYATITSVPDYAFRNLFYGDSNLIDTTNLNFGQVTSIGNYSMQSMYIDTSITTPPDLSGITTVGDNGSMQGMFRRCTLLVSTPNLSGLTSLGHSCMSGMLEGCTALENGVDLSGINSVGNYSIQDLYKNCSSLTTAYAPNVSSWDYLAQNWLYRVKSTGTLYCPSQAVADSIPTGVSGCPSGWNKQVIQ